MKHFNIYLTIATLFYSTFSFSGSTISEPEKCVNEDYLHIPATHWLFKEELVTQIQVLGYLSHINLEKCAHRYNAAQAAKQAHLIDDAIGKESRLELENEFKNHFDPIKTLVYVKKIKNEPLGKLKIHKEVISGFEKELIEGFEDELASYVKDDPEEIKCIKDENHLPIPDNHWLTQEEDIVRSRVLFYLSGINLANCANRSDIKPSVSSRNEVNEMIGQQKRLALENEFQSDFNVLKTLVHIKKIKGEPLGYLKAFKKEIVIFEKELIEGFEEELRESEEHTILNQSQSYSE